MIDEQKHAGEIAYFRMEMRKMKDPTTAKIREMVKNSVFPDGKNPNYVDDMVRYLESFYVVRQSRGTMIQAHGHRPWLAALRGGEGFTPHYWERLDQYLQFEKGLTENVADALDNDTDRILDHLGNPHDDVPWRKRGMVLGHVQSGKTTNYSALICKAIDAGYKVIILLTGTSNMLRDQTQQRIDEAVIGRQSRFGSGRSDTIGAGKYSPRDSKVPQPICLTSMEGDFNREIAKRSNIDVGTVAEPVIFVTKKNASGLSHLKEWLGRNNPQGGINSPLLLIDDEADNASINTREDPGEFTPINGKIREILTLFNRRSYVGYTATPFANIFIMPDAENDSEDDLSNDDLFPSDFIMALDAPDNYIGPDKMFVDNEDTAETNLRVVDDYHAAFPPRHKKDHDVGELPETLKTAIRLFVLCRAFISINKQTEHSTMMVNVSHYNNVQESVRRKVHEYLKVLNIAIRGDAGPEHAALHMDDLRRDFEAEYAGKGVYWNKMRSHLRAARSIEVLTVNMSGDTLDYDVHSETGRHVIAVGGFALSRGLTLEGLRISYLTRTVGAYDTLMQMGRWFGYRDKYEDFCRVFMPASMMDRYAFVAEATRELRDDIKLMNNLKETPRDFGLKVRRSPAGVVLQITARNKMRTAEYVRVAIDLHRKQSEAHTIFADKETNAKNFAHVRDFVKGLGKHGHPEADGQANHLFWQNVACQDVLRFMSGFKLPNRNADFIVTGGTPEAPQTLASDFISERADKFCRWDVCIPVRGASNLVPPKDNQVIPGLELMLRQRRLGVVVENVFYRLATKRIADRADAAIGLSQEQLDELVREQEAKAERGEDTKALSDKAFNKVRERPLLLLHMFDIADSKGHKPADFGDLPPVSYGICFPMSDVRVTPREYALNVVGQQRCFDFDSLMDGEEEDE